MGIINSQLSNAIDAAEASFSHLPLGDAETEPDVWKCLNQSIKRSSWSDAMCSESCSRACGNRPDLNCDRSLITGAELSRR